MDIGAKLKNRRLSLGLTLEEVGNAVGVGKSTVRKWETGDIANMRRDKIANLADALHTSPAYIMGWSDDPEAIEKPAPTPENELDSNLIKLLVKLTPEEIMQVDAFVQGLIAARKV